jgi:hypothetical protein
VGQFEPISIAASQHLLKQAAQSLASSRIRSL